MNITCVIFGITFIIIGFLFFIGKAHSHIEAYQKMTEEEKVHINMNSLCRNAGLVIGLAGIGFLLDGTVPVFSEKVFIWYMIAWFIGSGIDIRYISKSNRFINNPSQDGIYK